MKFLVYAVRKDELEAIEKYKKEFDLDIDIINKNFSESTADLAKGYDGISILGNCIANKKALNMIADFGVKVIANRSAGYDKIDIKEAKKLGIEVSNVPSYSPNAISEYAILSALMLARNTKTMFNNVDKNNYSLKGLIGFEIRKSTVGIIGTGRIGRETAKGFKGLGAKVLGYDVMPNDECNEYLKYVNLETLLKESDIITLHMPLLENNYHIINEKTIKMMKKNVVIVNTARGGLVNSEDIIKALENKDIAGYAMDVHENEIGILHIDRSNTPIDDEIFNKLHSLENVIISPHYAFYTDEAVSNMVEIAFKNLKAYKEKGKVIDSIIEK